MTLLPHLTFRASSRSVRKKPGSTTVIVIPNGSTSVATANPHVAFTAAYHLHKKHSVPYVMDYRDAWLLDVFTGDRLHEPNSRAAKWEKKLVESAREVWFVNDPIKDWHEKLYPALYGRGPIVPAVQGGPAVFDPV